MSKRIILNNRNRLLSSFRYHRKFWLLFLCGLSGVTAIWTIYYLVMARPAVIDLPDYTGIWKSRADWNDYLKINQTLSELKKGWSCGNKAGPGRQISEFGRKVFEESLVAQTGRIQEMFAEEEAFRRVNLGKSLALYTDKLHLEMERTIETEINALKNAYNKDVNNQELEVKKAVKQYNDEVAAEYQVTLANLQLQLLLVDLSGKVKDPVAEKQRIQDQIEKARREMYDKVAIRQRQLTDGQALFEKERRIILNAKIKEVRERLEISTENKINKYRETLEDTFDKWREQRKQEIQMVINLRQNNS